MGWRGSGCRLRTDDSLRTNPFDEPADVASTRFARTPRMKEPRDSGGLSGSPNQSPSDEDDVPAKNIYHDCVIQALIADGWTITDDPLWLDYGDRNLYVDVGAERATLGAEKAGRKIAVEVQSFVGASPVRDLQEAVGQYEVYRTILAAIQPDRSLYLAAPLRVYETLLTEKLGQLVVSRLGIRLLIFDHQQQRIPQWIEPSNTGRS
jgi:XisH protein